MSDLIRLVDLEVMARIGVPEAERAEPQRLAITLELAIQSLADAARTDDLALTVDYARVALRVKGVAEEKPRRLIETLAEELAAMVLNEFAVAKVTVEVKKFVLPETRYVTVRIERF